MADSGLRVVKLIGLVFAILTFIFVIVACVLNTWTQCDDMGYSSGLWAYKDKSTDMANLYEEKFIRFDQPDAKCSGKTPGNWNIETTDCSAGYKCNANFQVDATKTCSSGYQFDKSDGSCANTALTRIQLTGCKHPDCLGKVDGRYFLDKATCIAGYRCSSSGMTRGANVTCTGGQLFNSGSCASISKDGSTCEEYWRCDGTSDSTLATSTCGAGSYFDGTSCVGVVSSGNDDSAPAGCKHEDCVGKTDGPHRSGTPTSGFTYDVQCKKSYVCKASGRTRQNVADCTGSLQFTIAGSPPTCAAAPQSGCVASTCSGKSDGYHITDSGTCRVYIKCRQGVEESTGSCSANNFAIVSTSAVTCQFHRKDSSCNNYFTCSGTTVTEQTCASGKYYSEANKVCEDPVSSGGGTVATLPVNCKHADCPSDGTFWAKANMNGATYNTACNNAYTCAANVHTTLSQCPAGQQYQRVGATCTATPQSGCNHADCSGKANGYHVTDGTTCKNYIKCEYSGAKDIPKSGTCPSGRVFQITTGTCSTTTPSGSTTCKDPRCDANPNHTAHKSSTPNPGHRDCQSWYKCVNGFYTEGMCGANEYYHLGDAVCKSTFPYTGTDHLSRAFTCKDTRCFSLADGKHRVDADCKAYKTCSNKIQTAVTNCASNELFNSGDKLCQAYVEGNGKHSGCNINGGLGEWTSWSTCTNNKGNHFGLRSRTRLCNNPTQKNAGNGCSGSASEQTICWLCPTQSGMEVTRFFAILALALGGLGSIFALNTFCVSSSMYPTVLSSLCQLGVFVFALGSAVAYSSIYPKEVDSCFTTGAGWTLAIVAAVFGFIGFIVWIVAAVKVFKTKGAAKIGARE